MPATSPFGSAAGAVVPSFMGGFGGGGRGCIPGCICVDPKGCPCCDSVSTLPRAAALAPAAGPQIVVWCPDGDRGCEQICSDWGGGMSSDAGGGTTCTVY